MYTIIESICMGSFMNPIMGIHEVLPRYVHVGLYTPIHFGGVVLCFRSKRIIMLHMDVFSVERGQICRMDYFQGRVIGLYDMLVVGEILKTR